MSVSRFSSARKRTGHVRFEPIFSRAACKCANSSGFDWLRGGTVRSSSRWPSAMYSLTISWFSRKYAIAPYTCESLKLGNDRTILSGDAPSWKANNDRVERHTSALNVETAVALFDVGRSRVRHIDPWFQFIIAAPGLRASLYLRTYACRAYNLYWDEGDSPPRLP